MNECVGILVYMIVEMYLMNIKFRGCEFKYKFMFMSF